MPVTAVVMTRDEADNLPLCLAALGRFGQVLVVDSESGDGTPEIARRMGAEVATFRWNGRYPKKKQWCLENLSFAYDWVMFVDADEVVTEALAAEIAQKVGPGSPFAGYYVEGRYEFLGRRLRFGHRNSKLCLFDRHRARYPDCPDLHVTRMWEVEGHYQPEIDGPVGRLDRYLWHADQKPLYALFERHNRYSDWEAAVSKDARQQLALSEPAGRRLAKRIVGALPCFYVVVFLHDYVWRLGFLDGLPGFHFALFRAAYHWQVAVKRRQRARPNAGPNPLPDRGCPSRPEAPQPAP